MGTQFNTIATLNFNHAYFPDGRIESLSIWPTTDSALQLKKYDILTRRTWAGIQLMAGTSDVVDSMKHLQQDREEVKLSFNIFFTDPYFNNMSDLPLQVQGKILYFNNLASNTNSSDILLLNKEAKVSEADMIQLHKKHFTYHFPEPLDNPSIEVKDALGNTVLKDDISQDNPLTEYTIDLSDSPEGCYQVWINEAWQLTYYASDHLMWQPGIAVIDLFGSKQVPAEYQFIPDTDEEKSFETPAYTIAFGTRATTWVYYIIDRQARERINMGILTGSADQLFVATPDTQEGNPLQLANGDRAQVMELPEPQLLKANPEIDLQLMENFKKEEGETIYTGRTLVQNLPAPSPEFIKPDTSTNKVYSEMYIYL